MPVSRVFLQGPFKVDFKKAWLPYGASYRVSCTNSAWILDFASQHRHTWHMVPA